MFLRISPKISLHPLKHFFVSQPNRFWYKDLQLEDTDAVMDFWNKYYTPMDAVSTALGITPNLTAGIRDQLIPQFLKDPISFLTYTQDNELVGIKLNKIVDLSTQIPVPNVDGAPQILRSWFAVAAHFEDDLPRLVPEVKRWMYVYHGTVRPDFYRQGVATRQWHKTLELAEEFKCEGAFALTVHAGSQNGLAKLGFECVKEVKYRDYVDPVTQKKVFASVQQPESMKMVVKIL